MNTTTRSGELNDQISQSSSSERISQREYARRKGWQPSYINKLVKQGIVPLCEGRVDPAEADAAIVRHRDPARKRRQARTGAAPQQGNEGSAVHSDNGSDEIELDDTVSYAQARAVREAYRARREKLLYEQLRGRLLDAGELKTAAFKKARIVREALLNIPGRVSAVLAAESDEANVRTLLIAEIREALEALTEISPSGDAP